jgi:hypothetical protein
MAILRRFVCCIHKATRAQAHASARSPTHTEICITYYFSTATVSTLGDSAVASPLTAECSISFFRPLKMLIVTLSRNVVHHYPEQQRPLLYR